MAMPWSLAARAAALVVVVAPIGFVMGMPFPSGLRALGNTRLVAWSLATNSFASVIASLLCVPLAMFWGFTTVLITSVLLYLAAALLAPVAPLPDEDVAALPQAEQDTATTSKA